MAQRAIILRLLCNDQRPLWSRKELHRQLPDIGCPTLQLALELLAGDECIVISAQGGVQASLCARHLDELGLVAI